MDNINIITYTATTSTITDGTTTVSTTAGQYRIAALDWWLIVVTFTLIMGALLIYKLFNTKWN